MSRSQRFDADVLAAYGPLQRRFANELASLDIAVDTIPRMRISGGAAVLPDEITADGTVPLGRVIPAGINHSGHPTRARIVLFRMPIEQRATTPAERRELLTTVLVSLLAHYLNLEPTEIDPNFDW